MRKMQGKRKWNNHAFQNFLEISMESAGEQDWCRTVLREGWGEGQRR
jgi:hypothetical protein